MNVETSPAYEFKVNNNFSSRYARLLVNDDPSFDGFFAMRELRNTSKVDADFWKA